MFCSKCGKRLEEGSRFCSKCGMDNGIYMNREFQEDSDIEDLVLDEDDTGDMTYNRFDVDDKFDDAMDDDIDIENIRRQPKSRKSGSGKKKKSPPRRSDRSAAVIIAAVIVFTVALVIAAAIVFSGYKASRLEKFSQSIEAYEQMMKQHDSVYGTYAQLLEEAKQALEDGRLGTLGKLEKQMEEAIDQMEAESGNQQALSELKEIYTAVFAKYRITDNYKAIYDDVMARLDQAISDKDEDAARQLKKDLETLKTSLSIENQNLVQTMINEINMMDIDRANDSEKKTFEEYKALVEEYTADENYVEALKVLDSWKEMASLAEERIKESESKARESRERESRARESEEAEKEKETESEEASPEQPSGGAYIFPGSDSRYLTAAEITPLSAWEKKVARNEIYARHGRKFSDADLQAYFNSQSWYNGTVEPEQFSESVLNDYERKNVSLIRSLE